MANALVSSRLLHSEWASAFAGSLFIALCSAIWIPHAYIAFTLQTFALFVLALTLPPRVCFFSLLFYLGEATLGLPVLSVTPNPLWFLFPTAGYLIAFLMATPLMAFGVRASTSQLQKGFALFCGLAVIYFGGWVVLSHFIGPTLAWKYGVLPFILWDSVKLVFALGFVAAARRMA